MTDANTPRTVPHRGGCITLFRYVGGKGHNHALPLSCIPLTSRFVDACGGAGNIFVRRPRSPYEVFNDISGDIVNLFRVARDPAGNAELLRLHSLTPYSRREFTDALAALRAGGGTPVERAFSYLVAMNMNFGGKPPKTGGCWARSRVVRCGKPLDVAAWQCRANALAVTLDRFRDAILDCRDAMAVMRDYDSPDTAFYLDPPYAPSARAGAMYPDECDEAWHARLAAFLPGVAGSVTLSGYPCAAYEPLEAAGWERRESDAYLTVGRQEHKKTKRRTECVWLNPRCQELLASQKNWKPLALPLAPA